MKEKVVIVTGGTSGIGKACAEEFGKAGCSVVITGRNESALKETSEVLGALGINNLAIRADASIREDNEKIAIKTIEHFGRIDILINNAGISMRSLLEDIDLDVFEKVMDINFNGTLYATKYCLPHILKTKGSIIGMSSINGYRGTPARTAYTASKYAMNGFLESLRTEVMKRGVHVLVACPGFTESNIRNAALTSDGTAQKASPLNENKLMSSEAVAKAILKATKKRKRDLVLTAQGKFIVFLNKWLPSLADRLVYNHFAKEEGSLLK